MKTPVKSYGWRGIVLYIVPAVLAVCLPLACTSAPKVSEYDELDAAIRQAADYFNANIPGGNKLAIIAIKSDYPPLSEYVIDALMENIVNDRLFTVVERHQLDTIRAELNFQMSGEVDDNSAQAIGRMVGAQTIIAGSVSAFGTMWRITLRALTVEKAEVQGLFNMNIPGSGTIAIRTSGPKGTAAAAQNGPQPSGPQAASITPHVFVLNDGTYTLMPRPRGRLDGVWENIYISRIEVDSEYMTFYFENRETAGDGYGRSSTVNWDRGYATLTDLDKPNIYKRNTGRTGQNNGYLVSCVFPRIDGKRLRLENRQGLVFAEIVIDESVTQG
jgi:hypothetical protein